MQFKCEIDMDNDASDAGGDYHRFELSRVLNKVAREFYEFECSERTKTIWDINGNKIGTWEIKV
jgi:hypothetical protein|tara:strand:+ start:290 stop:481 length:192 start_codon:yes stop_codon:yes gene_type:complete